MLEAKLREVLAAAEERERRVVAAEEALARRRKDLDREHQARLQEAEAAVRRLQADFEHSVGLERERCAELGRQKQDLERRLVEAQARADAVERDFGAYREQQRRAPEGRAQAELVLAIEARLRAEERAERLARAKRQYKEQVLALAREVGVLQRQRIAEAEQWIQRERRHVDQLALASAAERQAQEARGEAGELGEVRRRLQQLMSQQEDVQVLPDAVLEQQLPQQQQPEPQEGQGKKGTHGEPSPVPRQSVEDLQAEMRGELRRLIQERAELLGTGVYSDGDPIILEIGQQIEAISISLGTSD